MKEQQSIKQKWNRFLSYRILLAAVIILAGVFASPQKANASTSITVDEAMNWVHSQVGKGIDDDGQYGTQCVDLIRAYYRALGVSPVGGNGADYASNSLPAGWSRVAGGAPQRGDILVYSGNSSNTYGHVAIFETANATYHQNYSGHPYVEKVTSPAYNGFTNPYWGYIRPNWKSARFNYSIDSLVNTKDGLRIVGWVYDKQAPSASCTIHVYVGGPAGSVQGNNIGSTDLTRADVNNTFGISGKHGFDKKFTTTYSGTQTVYIYALNGSYNELLTTKTLNVGSNPIGSLDNLESSCSGVIKVRGWTLDTDGEGYSNEYHVYVGAPAGQSGTEGHAVNVAGDKLFAGKYRKDVDDAYHGGAYHGFEDYVATNKTGTQMVYIYGINMGNGTNVLVGSKQVTISSAAHSYNDGVIVKAATCTSAGQKKRTCTRCGTAKTETIPKIAHQEGEPVKENVHVATCVVEGSYDEVVYCTSCKKELSRNTVTTKKASHNWDDGQVTEAATTSSEGVMTYTCLSCGEEKTETIAKLSDTTSPAIPLKPASAPSVEDTEKEIIGNTEDEAPAGATFSLLQVRASTVKKTSIKLQWTKVKGATGYVIYGARCGRGYEKLKKITNGNTKTWTQKKLTKGKYYKYYIAAVKKYKGVDKVIASSKTIHVATTGGKVGNYKSVKLNNVTNNKLSLKVGKKFTIDAKEVAASKTLKPKRHRKLAYESTNPSIATVSAKGRISAKAAGSCYVYVYTQSGTFEKIKVTVK